VGKGLCELVGSEMGERPRVLFFELFFDGGAAELRWQDFPCVGFHFQMGAKRGVFAEEGEGIGEVVAGVTEGFVRWSVEGDVKVDAPFIADWLAAQGGGERLGEVTMAAELAVVHASDGLVKVDVLLESREGAKRRRCGLEAEGVAEVKFAQTNAGIAKGAQRGRGVFVFYGEVAGVIVDA
jgi:hypothetical protein